jgi:predicted ATPase/transcriptional regulator with XRE-family HTH domain
MSEGITFGSWLKQRRNEMGITQDVLAESLGFSPITLWKIEAGERRPSSQTAALLADYFRVPDDEREAFIIFARSGRAGRVVAGSLGVGAPSAPWRAEGARHTNLPMSLTPLIGREEEVRTIIDLFVQPRSKVRLVTLTGAPGIGKTRLALQVAAELVGAFDDGTFFVELAPVTDPDLVMPTIAQTLGIIEVGGQGIEEVVRQYLQGRRLLLVLDNFEQVLDAAPGITRLLEASPWLKVLATSREALHVRGERRFPVLPLEVPGSTFLVQSDSASSGTLTLKLGTVPSVQLFVERAQAVEPGFAVTQENAWDVASICARLEGLPLAIELAAARVGLFTPATMLARLEHRLSVLTGGARDLPERQRALRNTIGWSYDLLSAEEQGLFRRLAVFVGGCTVEAVEALGNAEAVAAMDILDGLQSLMNKSLLSVREEPAPATAKGTRQKQGKSREVRFVMLETISEYTFERLRESAESQVIPERHAGYFLRLVEEAEPELRGAKQLTWLDTLEAEHDNIRAALRWALENKAASIGLRLVGALRWFWTQRSHLTEGLRWARSILAMPNARERSAERAKALWSAGALAWLQGDPGARPLLEESVDIWREVGDKSGLGHSLLILGMVALQQGQPQVALSHQSESISVFRDAGDKSGLTLALGSVSFNFWALQDAGANGYSESDKEHRALLEEAIELARETEDKWSLALTLRSLGWLAIRQGDYSGARPLIEESLAIQWEMGTTHEVAATLADVALLAKLDGELEVASEVYGQSLDAFRECADRQGMVSSMANIGVVALRMGDTGRATEVLAEALEMVKELESTRHSLITLEAIGWLMSGIGQPERAATLLSAVQALYRVNSFTRPVSARIEYDAQLKNARGQVGETNWEEAWARGETMSIEDALRFASESLEVSFHALGGKQA